MAPAADVDVTKLRAALDEWVDGGVRFDPGTLDAYAQDASNYRQVPIGVVVPRTVDASTWTCWTAGAAGWPATSALRAAITRCPWPVPSTGCGRPSGTRARRPRCWPTGSPAALRSRPGTSAGRASTWPSCSPSSPRTSTPEEEPCRSGDAATANHRLRRHTRARPGNTRAG